MKAQRVFVDTYEAARIVGVTSTHFRKYFADKHGLHAVNFGKGLKKKHFYLVKELEALKGIADGDFPTGRREIHRRPV